MRQHTASNDASGREFRVLKSDQAHLEVGKKVINLKK